jgi:hypothetical protein
MGLLVGLCVGSVSIFLFVLFVCFFGFFVFFLKLILLRHDYICGYNCGVSIAQQEIDEEFVYV